jgi:hypothetical protein
MFVDIDRKRSSLLQKRANKIYSCGRGSDNIYETSSRFLRIFLSRRRRRRRRRRRHADDLKIRQKFPKN